MADISKIKTPDGTTYNIKDSRAVVTNDNNSVYTNVASAYIGGTGGKPYWKITIPNISTRWTIITLYFNVQQTYSVGYGGKIIVNGYHNATSPYTWSGLTYSVLGYLSSAIKVHACDGDTFYIEGLTTGYFNVDLERILVADSARGVDISGTIIERVSELPSEYVSASFRQNQYVGDIGNGTPTTFAYSKSGLDSVAWYAAWHGYELRAVAPSKVIAGNVSGTVAVDHGGTGATSAVGAANNILSGLPDWSADPTDTTKLIRKDTGGTASFGQVTFSTVWNYIKSKIESLVLSTSTSSTSTTTAATSSAVKTAYDLANTANGTANTALSGLNGTLIYDHTYSISGGVATFTAHVYCKGQEVTSTYADSCFTWSYRLDSAISGTPSVVSLGTGKTKTITISTLGYGGHVIGSFTPPA